MEDNKQNTTEDLFPEHKAGFHTTYTAHCSDCFKENRLIQAHKVVNIPPIEMPPRNWAKGVMNKIIYGDEEKFYDK